VIEALWFIVLMARDDHEDAMLRMVARFLALRIKSHKVRLRVSVTVIKLHVCDVWSPRKIAQHDALGRSALGYGSAHLTVKLIMWTATAMICCSARCTCPTAHSRQVSRIGCADMTPA
jgi:hypothetical protein